MAFTHRCFYSYFFTQSKRIDNKITKPKHSVFFPTIFALDGSAVLKGGRPRKSSKDAPALCICYQDHFHLHRGERHPPPRGKPGADSIAGWSILPNRDGGQRRGRALERSIPSGVDGCSTLTAACNLQGLRDKGAVREKPGQRDKRAYSVQLLGR